MAQAWRLDRRKTSERGYGSAWQHARHRFLQLHPLCVMCQAMSPPRTVAATVVDHRIPHRGDAALFWDMGNWQALCTMHHSSHKQALERSGRVIGQTGVDGYPVSAMEAPGC